MVACHDENADASGLKLSHPIDEIQAGVVILPVTIVEIAGKQDKSDVLFNRQINQVIEGAARGTADFLDRSTRIALESAERTVEMNVGGVDEFQMLVLDIYQAIRLAKYCNLLSRRYLLTIKRYLHPKRYP